MCVCASGVCGWLQFKPSSSSRWQNAVGEMCRQLPVESPLSSAHILGLWEYTRNRPRRQRADYFHWPESVSCGASDWACVRNWEMNASETHKWDFRETEKHKGVWRGERRRREEKEKEEKMFGGWRRERLMWLQWGGRLGQVDECLGFKNRCHPELVRAGHNDLQSPKPNRQPSDPVPKIPYTHATHQSTNTMCLSKDSLSQHPGLMTHTNSLILPLLSYI